jgi:hypothetical protein
MTLRVKLLAGEVDAKPPGLDDNGVSEVTWA